MKQILFVLLFLCHTGGLHAADIVALCIGNDEYPGEDALDTPVADAILMQQTLQRLPGEVKVMALHNGTWEAMHATLNEFAITASGAKLALVFYSGHGLEDKPVGALRPDTYLLPVDRKIEHAAQLSTRTLALSTVLAKLGETRAAAKLVILDCCRSHPVAAARPLLQSTFAGSLDSRVKMMLDQAPRPEGTMIAFATSPGNKAAAFLKSTDANSPFTDFIIKNLGQSGLSLRDVIERASDATEEATEGKQVPHLSYDGASSLFRRLVLVPTNTAFSAPAIPMVPTVPAPVPSGLGSATKVSPFVNSLGMRFVPAGTPGILFSVYETRVKDFEAFVEATGYDAITNTPNGAPAFTYEKKKDGSGLEWRQEGGSWRDPRFPSTAGQNGEHSVVCASYLDAEHFCEWLTKKDREAGKIPASARYRLPTDEEWSRANGGGEYPWGDEYPPKSEDGNYLSHEAMIGVLEGHINDLVKAGRRDVAARTAEVSLFRENRHGLYDLGGNVSEWCSTWYTAGLNDRETLEAVPVLKDDGGGQKFRVVRGGSWNYFESVWLRSAFRYLGHPRIRYAYFGFRCVMEVSGG